MAKYGRGLNLPLSERQLPGFRKRFDLVSSDGCSRRCKVSHSRSRRKVASGQVHGNRRTCLVAAGHSGQAALLVFGNQRRVGECWLEKYGWFVSNVEFNFLRDDVCWM